MKTYTVVSSNWITFDLNQDDIKVGSLKYASWFSLKAEGSIVGENGRLRIEPKGFWATTIVMKRVANELLSFKMDWSGNVVIDTNFEHEKDSFKFRRAKPLGSSYVLVDKDGIELLSVVPDLNWSSWRSDYLITTSDAFEMLTYKYMMLLALIHVTNYYISMSASGAQ